MLEQHRRSYEADRILEQNFEEDMKQILKRLPQVYGHLSILISYA
jgi:superfamily II DNA/RNA helicase